MGFCQRWIWQVALCDQWPNMTLNQTSKHYWPKPLACPFSYLFNFLFHVWTVSWLKLQAVPLKAYSSDVGGVPRFRTSHWERKQLSRSMQPVVGLTVPEKMFGLPSRNKNLCKFPEQTVDYTRYFLWPRWNPVPVHHALVPCVLCCCQVLLDPAPRDLQPTLAMEWLTQLNYPLTFLSTACLNVIKSSPHSKNLAAMSVLNTSQTRLCFQKTVETETPSEAHAYLLIFVTCDPNKW